MSRVPNAWDDDYEAVADSKARQPPPAPRPAHAPAPKISHAERRAQHAEANRTLWNSAQNAETFHFVEATSSVPLKSELKPQLKVLSRKPKKPEKPSTTLEAGIGGMSLSNGANQEDDPDSEEEARREQVRTLKDRQEKAKLEREEKQRRYNERREQLFGSPTPAVAKEATSGTSSPAGTNANGTSKARHGRGGNRGTRGQGQGSHTPSSADQSPARATTQTQRQLYDPAYSAKPDSVYLQKRDGGGPSTPNEVQTIRSPRGPDGSGRGGAGFAARGRGRGV